MEHSIRFARTRSCLVSIFVLLLCATTHLLDAQAPAVPEWAQPGSPTDVQVPPPADFHRPSRGHLKKGNFMYAKERRRGFWGFGAV